MRRIVGGLAALALSFAGLIGTATPAQAVAPQTITVNRYAALGDSFAAGYGLPSKSDPASQLCARSNLAYPELLNGFPKLKNLDFVACSGSTTTDVLTGQLAGLSASTRTVTLTVGGNDLGFGELACLQTGCDLTPLIAAASPALATLAAGPAVPGSLSGLLVAIHARAPQARIFVTGYPKLFGTASKIYGTRTACPVPLAARTAVNSLVGSLNSVITGAVAGVRAAGVDVVYVGVAGAFAQHGVCDSRVPFISTVLHPNLLGQATYATALTVKGVTR
ncbi:MAG TPA: SGNH/GDSL hydrolase family protein [Propionicimonas sp.]|nr:SGNH/GDSL hydrolase family protein [Propionicimonas sp.]